MKMKKINITRIAIIVALFFALAIFILASKLKEATTELEIATETLTACDENHQRLEKKLFLAKDVIYEYRTLFPTRFMESMHIDTNELNELWAKYKAIK
jgi:hypothetical protein